jgi:hypothetical protein
MGKKKNPPEVGEVGGLLGSRSFYFLRPRWVARTPLSVTSFGLHGANGFAVYPQADPG